jgi:hypothetical protein
MSQKDQNVPAVKNVLRIIDRYDRSYVDNRKYNELIASWESYDEEQNKSLAEAVRKLLVIVTRTRRMNGQPYDSRFLD